MSLCKHWEGSPHFLQVKEEIGLMRDSPQSQPHPSFKGGPNNLEVLSTFETFLGLSKPIAALGFGSLQSCPLPAFPQ